MVIRHQHEIFFAFVLQLGASPNVGIFLRLTYYMFRLNVIPGLCFTVEPLYNGPVLSGQFSKSRFFSHTNAVFVTCIRRPPLLSGCSHPVAVLSVCLSLLFCSHAIKSRGWPLYRFDCIFLCFNLQSKAK